MVKNMAAKERSLSGMEAHTLQQCRNVFGHIYRMKIGIGRLSNVNQFRKMGLPRTAIHRVCQCTETRNSRNLRKAGVTTHKGSKVLSLAQRRNRGRRGHVNRTWAEISHLCPTSIEVDPLAVPKLRLIEDFWGVLKQEVDKTDRDPKMKRIWKEGLGIFSGDWNDIDWDSAQCTKSTVKTNLRMATDTLLRALP